MFMIIIHQVVCHEILKEHYYVSVPDTMQPGKDGQASGKHLQEKSLEKPISWLLKKIFNRGD